VKRVYIAGPMKGIPLFNFPAFDDAENFLDEQVGVVSVSPAQIDRDNGFDPIYLPADYDWNVIPVQAGTREEIMRRDINALLACDAIYMLPGWENSAGAKAELHLARWAGLEILQDPMAKSPLLGDNSTDLVKPKEFKDSVRICRFSSVSRLAVTHRTRWPLS